MKKYCPKCLNEPKEVWLVYTSFLYCSNCKEDIEVLEPSNQTTVVKDPYDPYEMNYLQYD